LHVIQAISCQLLAVSKTAKSVDLDKVGKDKKKRLLEPGVLAVSC